jgi:ribosome-binding protein aMBF1 (putative translation factor)
LPGRYVRASNYPYLVSENLCETQLQQALLPPLRVSLGIDHEGLMQTLTGKGDMTMVLVREAVGQTLRAARTSQGRTLRDVAREARVSLGYLSEVERGQKEASSELLNAICSALGLSLSGLFAQVALELKSREGVTLTVVDAA